MIIVAIYAKLLGRVGGELSGRKAETEPEAVPGLMRGCSGSRDLPFALVDGIEVC